MSYYTVNLKQKILYSKDKAYKRKKGSYPKGALHKKDWTIWLRVQISQKFEVIMEKICTKDLKHSSSLQMAGISN